MTDVLRLLPPLEYRGNVYPVTSREVYFQHEGARHKLQYRDGEIIEQLGVQGLTFSYTIPMREDIARGPYKNLFSTYLPILFTDAFNRERGPLYDPIYGGPFQVVPVSYRDVTDITKRDGTDISIEFVRSLSTTELEVNPVVTIDGIVGEAGALDAELPELQEFEQFRSKNGGTDALSAIAGALAQARRQGEKAGHTLGDLANKCDKLDKEITKAENPQLWGIQQSARRLRFSALRLKEQGENPTRKVVTVINNAAKTIAGVSAELGLTLSEFLDLNPELVTAPLIPSGVAIRTYQRP